MALAENLSTDINTGESKIIMNSTNAQDSLNLQSCINPTTVDDLNDDLNDIDLSDIVPSIIDPSLTMGNPVQIMTGNESYKEIINVCSSTAQAIKKSISDALSSRENVVITDVDETSELQASLNKKIADFNSAVDGCMKTDISNLISTADKSDNSCELSENVEVDLDSKGKSSSRNSPEIGQDVLDEIGNSDTSSSESSNYCGVPSATVGDTKGSKNIKASKSSSASKTNTVDACCRSEKLQSVNTDKESSKTSSIEEDKNAKKIKISSSKKKGEKTVDQILKSLSVNLTTDEKLLNVCKKYVESLEELRQVEPRIRQLERQVISQQREKESLQAEHNRMILAKSRLEGLCREMQRQSKVVKEESLLRLKEEEEKRKEVANKFQSTLNDISALMQENTKRNTALREENGELSQKLKLLVDNYSVWEENMKKIVQQKELETQLANTKHAKVNLELKQETEKFLREKQSLLENMSELQKKCTLLTANELQLRTELGDYTNKYEEFQSVLTNSSKVFASFKADMDSTSKKIKKLEKETNLYKQKWESSNKALLDMISNKEKQDRETANAQQRISTLEKLCRALQSERTELRNKLNAATSSIVCAGEQSLPSVPTEVPVEPSVGSSSS